MPDFTIKKSPAYSAGQTYVNEGGHNSITRQDEECMAQLFIPEHHDDGNLAFGFTAQKVIRDCWNYLNRLKSNFKLVLYSINE
jgi:hypothetical protein